MKIKAVLVFALCSIASNESFAAHCDKSSWHTLLQHQIALEDWYNQYSQQFNEVLKTYQSQVLTKDRFTEQQLIDLWAKDLKKTTHKLKGHMQSAYHASEVLLQHAHLISIEAKSSESLSKEWGNIATHCLDQARPNNVHTALHNNLESSSLAKDLMSLSNKFRQLSNNYKAEATLLDKTRRRAAPY